MKNLITCVGLLFFILFIVSCTKRSDTNADPVIDESNLTSCPLNAKCNTLFTENAAVDSVRPFLKVGVNRVFFSTVETDERSADLFIIVPMKGTSFALTKKDITSGAVKLFESCPACYSIGFQIVDGYVAGVNLSPTKSADQTKWIIEAQLIREAKGQPGLKDTVRVKQYFSPNFVYN